MLLCDFEDEGAAFWLFDARNGLPVLDFERPSLVGQPLFSADSRFFAWTDADHAAQLHDAATGKVMRTLKSNLPRGVMLHLARLACSRDGDYLAIVSDLTENEPPPEWKEGPSYLLARVFHTPTGREINQFQVYLQEKHNPDEPQSVALSPCGRLLAVSDPNHGIRLLEVATGKLRAKLTGHRDEVASLAFSPDGQTLASGGSDNVIYLWDVTGAKTKAVDKDLDAVACWRLLAQEDGVQAGEALAALLRQPEGSVAFLKEKLQPVAALEPKRLPQLLAELDADAFEKREAASRELEQLGDRAEAALRQALKATPSLEAKRRIEELLEKLASHALAPETLRGLRALEALEHLDTPAARQLLAVLAEGAAEARLTQEAKASLARLRRQ